MIERREMPEFEELGLCRQQCASLRRLPVQAEPLAGRIGVFSQGGLQPSSIAVDCHRAPAGISVARARCRDDRWRIVIDAEKAAPENAWDAIESVGLIDEFLARRQLLPHPSIHDEDIRSPLIPFRHSGLIRTTLLLGEGQSRGLLMPPALRSKYLIDRITIVIWERQFGQYA